MFRRDVKPIDSLMAQFLRASGLETPLLQWRLVNAWPEVAGEVIARYTGSVFLDNQTLNVNIQPITYRFIRRGNKWYLRAIFENRFEETEYVTSKFNGVIGLAYNDGFIQLSETDKSGNLVHLQKYDLQFHGCGNKAKTELEQTLHVITKYAVKVGKDIVIEDLDFKNTRAKQIKAKSKKGKDYNRMLYRFDYTRYKQKLKEITFNQKVFIALVSPRNTSKIGKQKYSNLMKLTIHQAASYVIARRYQGFKDNLKTT